jgi:nucleotide-binding universal stress UspA family protein
MTEFNPSKILIPIDFSEISLLAIEQGGFLAKENKAEIILLHVHHEPNVIKTIFTPSETARQKELEQNTHLEMEKVKESLFTNYGVVAQIIVRSGNPKKEIINVANEINATLIIMGTHGYGRLEEIFIGSNTLKVITNAPCPIMATSYPAKKTGFTKIVLPIDTSMHARQKVKFAIQFAKKFDATIHAVALLTASESHHEPSLNVMLNQVKKFAAESHVKVISEVKTNVSNRAQTTIDYVNEIEAELIIITADQDAEISQIYLGPYKQQILHISPIPVITIQPKSVSATTLVMFGT